MIHTILLLQADVQTLQKAKVDLDIAKTIALSAKSNLKRRTILLRSARRRNAPDEVKMVPTFNNMGKEPDAHLDILLFNLNIAWC